MSIKLTDHKNLSEKLKSNITALASKYCPEGELTVYKNGQAIYRPAPHTLSALEIKYSGEEITGVGQGYKSDTCPELEAFIVVFEKAKKRLADKQKASSPKNSTVLSVDSQATPAPKEPVKMPTLDISTFSGVRLPNSASEINYGSVRFKHKGKEHSIYVSYSHTQDTNTHYLSLQFGEGWTDGRYSLHRFMGKSAVDLVRKLEQFLSVSEGSLNILIDEQYFKDLGKSSYSVNALKTANFLAKCEIKK